ncbi:hypothetical protein PMI54_005315 [Salmonella enterica]|nr:hypothetical protein [Salmonella enterica]
MQWNDGSDIHGHVIVALDGDYTDLTHDQFQGYDDWIVAEPVESGGQMDTFLQKVRNLEGSVTTQEVTLDVIPRDSHKLYGWLKATADSRLPVPGQNSNLLLPLSTEILSEYRDQADIPPRRPSGKILSDGCLKSVRYPVHLIHH